MAISQQFFEYVHQHVHNDGVTGAMVYSRVAHPDGTHGLLVLVGESHQPHALQWCEFAELPFGLRGNIDGCFDRLAHSALHGSAVVLHSRSAIDSIPFLCF